MLTITYAQLTTYSITYFILQHQHMRILVTQQYVDLIVNVE